MKNSHFMLAALALVSIACTKELPEGASGMQESTELSAKLVGGTDGEIAPGTLLVRLDAQSVNAIEEGRLAEVSQDLLDGIEGATLRSALPVQPKNMEVARKYGLDQWFMVSFGSQTSAEEVAQEMASSRRVRSIQYNRLVQPVWEGQVHPFEAMPMTKAQDPEQSGMFNDEYASYQWNLYNDGSIDENAVPGADVGVKDAWRLTGGDPSVVVAIFDCAVANRHEDLQDALWQNEAEVNGQADVDDDGNGFIDDKYGFNFVNCYSIDAEYVDGALKGQKQTALKGNPLNSTAGSGHGTHVAGIIGATNNNGKGVSSIAGGTGNGDRMQISFNSQSAVQKLNAFYADAIAHFDKLYGNDILFYLPTFSMTAESEYWGAVGFNSETNYADYSDNAIVAFRAFLAENYDSIESLNAVLGTNYASFEDVTPPLTVTNDAFGQLWYIFRHQSLKNVIDMLATTQKKIAPKSKFALQYCPNHRAYFLEYLQEFLLEILLKVIVELF